MTYALLAALSGCDVGGLAVPVPLIDAPDEVVLTGPVDEVAYADVTLVNLGTAAVTVDVTVDVPFTVDAERLSIAAGSRTGLLVSWTPDTFNREVGILTIVAGDAERQARVDGLVLEDADGDGYSDTRAGGSDCDDADDAVFPGAPDACGDGLDTDCDGVDPLC